METSEDDLRFFS